MGNALHHACEYNRSNAIQLLIEGGIDINAIDNNGSSALEIALAINSPECTKVLIDAGVMIQQEHLDNDDVKSVLADNAARRADMRVALEEISFQDITKVDEFLDFLFLQ